VVSCSVTCAFFRIILVHIIRRMFTEATLALIGAEREPGTNAAFTQYFPTCKACLEFERSHRKETDEPWCADQSLVEVQCRPFSYQRNNYVVITDNISNVREKYCFASIGLSPLISQLILLWLGHNLQLATYNGPRLV